MLRKSYRRLKKGRFNPRLGRSPGRGHDDPLQYSCLENPMDRGAWWATVRGVPESRTRLKQLSTASVPTGMCHLVPSRISLHSGMQVADSSWPGGGFGSLGKGRFHSPSNSLRATLSPSQSEAKWTARITELEKDRDSLMSAMACREEELSALRKQLEYTQLKLSSAQASTGCSWGRPSPTSHPWALGCGYWWRRGCYERKFGAFGQIVKVNTQQT